MKLKPFLLDHWLNHYHFADPPIRYDLASSTGPVWTAEQVLDLMGEAQRRELNETRLLYCNAPGTKELREAIAGMQGVDPDDVQITTGAAEALLILFFLAAEPAANVVLPFPGFPPFHALPESFGIETRYYHLRPENQFRIDLDEIKKQVDHNTRLILVNSPHNPTGTTLTDAELLSLHGFAAEREVQFVVDEVYHPIYHGQPTASAAALPRATVLGDFSKAFCLSGLRVGWIVERNRNRIEQYLNARCYFTVSNTPVGEAMALAAVRNREAIFSRVHSVSTPNLEALDAFFATLSGVLGWVRPGGGMTGFPWLINQTDSRAFCEKAAERGVLLAPGDCFGMPRHFRLGFGAAEAGFTDALAELESLISREIPADVGQASSLSSH
jgi:aspartate/methionine/tyrosine aminotransferase